MSNRAAARSHLAVALLLACIGYGVAACQLAGLSWDGSWYLFRSLQDGKPFIPHLRYGTYPILWLVVRVAQIIHHPAFLGVLYGALLTLFPIGALALSWWYLRGEARAPLRVWPALGILIAPLPGQFCLMSEATPAAQLMWPILAIITAGPIELGGGLWLIALSAALCLLHPTSALVFAFAAGLLGWQSWNRPEPGKAGWIWAGSFVAMALGEIVLALLSASQYERSQASWREMWKQFEHSVLGFPLLLLVLMYLLGLLILEMAAAVPRLSPPGIGLLPQGKHAANRPQEQRLRNTRLPLEDGTIRALCAVLLGAAAIIGSLWAHEPVRWSGLLDYRRFVLPAMLPLVAMAAWHRRVSATSKLPASWILPWISALFCLVLATQSLAWKSLLDRFVRQLRSRAPDERFVSADELPLTHHTALRHWTACPLSILLQDGPPAAVFVLKPGDVRAHVVQVNAWEQIPFADGWFALHQLERMPAGKRATGQLPPVQGQGP